MKSSLVTAAALAAVAAAIASLPLRPARGATGTTGELAQGGTARGDISKTAADVDKIGVQLVAGSQIDVRWSSGFPGDVHFFGPDGLEIALGLDAGKSASVTAWPVPADGRYEFRIASADGSQGLYTLKVTPRWAKTVELTGSGDTTFDVLMPALSSLKGKVESLPGASNPSVLSLRSPADVELLVNPPLVGSPGLAKMKSVDCPAAGVYRFTATATAGTLDFAATLKRRARPIPLTRVNIRNGLDQISYANDGVEAYFDARCASCHSWASSYTGVRAFATLALGRMKTGNMPLGGPRADAATISLVQEWIQTGYGR
jgi:hypothetical protein